MMTFMRTIIDLPADQIQALDALSKRENISRAEAVRRAVAEHLQRHLRSGADRAFGIWRDRKEDGLAYQERVRREWDHRS